MFSIFNFMKFLEPISVSRISCLLDIPFFGDGEKLVYGLNEINRCKEGDIVFVNHPKYQAKAELSKATAIITKIRNLDCKKIIAMNFAIDRLCNYVAVSILYR